MYFLTFVLILAASAYYFRFRQRSKYKLPPGPLSFPIIGNINQLIFQNPFEKFREWAAIYGKFYTINICTKPAIVINDPKLMREIFNTFQSTGKFLTDTMLLPSQGPYGVLNSEGHVWSEQRKFCLKKLKEFGFGNKRMETLILTEADEICKWIVSENKKNNGKPLHIHAIFLQSVINTMWTMVAGTRITLGDSKMAQLLENFMDSVQCTVKTGLFFLPWLKYIIPGRSGYTEYNKACLEVIKFIEKEFISHKNTFSMGTQRDLIDAYIEDSNTDPLKWKNAVATVVELFMAASETTGSTMQWLLCYLSVNSDIQLRLQNELDTVIGENQEISLDHKASMPYTEAVILETLRLSSLGPIGVIHKLLDDLEIDGYKLPKGLILIPNLYHCHHNIDVWKDPEVFRPERFLDIQGNKLKEHVVPFQLGKRQCVGEPLAKDILFVFTTRIFQLFNVKPDKNEEEKDYYKPSDVGYAHMPPKLGVYVSPRIRI